MLDFLLGIFLQAVFWLFFSAVAIGWAGAWVGRWLYQRLIAPPPQQQVLPPYDHLTDPRYYFIKTIWERNSDIPYDEMWAKHPDNIKNGGQYYQYNDLKDLLFTDYHNMRYKAEQEHKRQRSLARQAAEEQRTYELRRAAREYAMANPPKPRPTPRRVTEEEIYERITEPNKLTERVTRKRVTEY